MRPFTAGPYSPITALTTAFNAQTFNSTGAAVAPTTTATSDGLAHLVTLTSPVQNSLAGVTFTIVGTDADGHAQTETGLVGPGSNATVTSSKYFKTISTIQPSATMGALVVSVGVAAGSLSPTIPLDSRSPAVANVSVSVTGTISFTGQETNYNVFDATAAPAFTAISALTTKSALTFGACSVGATGFNVLTNSVTNGATYTIHVSQPNAVNGG